MLARKSKRIKRVYLVRQMTKVTKPIAGVKHMTGKRKEILINGWLKIKSNE